MSDETNTGVPVPALPSDAAMRLAMDAIQRVGGVESRIAGQETRLTTLEGRLFGFGGDPQDRGRLGAIEARVDQRSDTLEDKIGAVISLLGKVGGGLGTLLVLVTASVIAFALTHR